jgi:hypothetical protein
MKIIFFQKERNYILIRAKKKNISIAINENIMVKNIIYKNEFKEKET